MGAEAAQILVIDDDEVVLVAIADLLEGAGYRVLTQTSPVGAADLVIREDVDAAIIDMNMPVMRGDNVIRLFRSRARARDIPIILVSGDEPERLERVRAQLPGIGIVSKANMSTQLAKVLASLLSERRRTSRSWSSIPVPKGPAV